VSSISPEFGTDERERIDKSKRHVAKDAVVARLHARVAALRREFYHATANDLLSRYGAIGIEDLNIAGMKRNHKLARHISDAAWASFLAILEYKADAAEIEIVRAGRWFPSSQRCADCGQVNRTVRDLAIRTWACPACGVIHDRDVNAARNLVPSPAAIAAARAVRLAERAEKARKRQGHKDRAVKASATKLATKIERQASAPARRPGRGHSAPVAATQAETRNARGGPVSPKARTSVPAAVARTETPTLRRKETRTEQSGLPISLIDSGMSLGSPHSPPVATGV
jgi:IS605 OrfB family transposase